ncbi:integral membrane sensor signal transduction histidine kinase [Sediminispirochaeta smaragdinae DSM 11293]|uniref:Integral membrane sensor signal transduction histidine kinase n=1 Tax=Sediminispirochaeta smaragdinae (strain DSM 11293 / JCM 15392 / SEBR 4228) TaxID=573413 RepID=E1R2F2_SEDSS|nr:integral membrane sensor signal transduction histidine kinase [Sediminispirochaeta smaragdinae DSM 11293]
MTTSLRLLPGGIELDRWKSRSIQQTLRHSYIIIICLTLVAPMISLAFSWYQTLRYDRMITNVSRTNRLNQIVKSDISNELWDIVAGNKSFDEGQQYGIIRNINMQLDSIMRDTEVRENRQLLEVAGRAMNTLTDYVDRLGNQMRKRFPVTENEAILDEIRGVAELVSDILQDFIVLEIESASRTNESIKQTATLLSLLQIVVVAVVVLFAVFAQRSVSTSINRPIRELEALSNQIAAGNLSARAETPHVEELDNLTENLNIMAVKIKELINANIQEQKNLQKSEMKALQAQITPHFLYNTLDSIIWLAEGREYEQVISVTRSFSNFFRRSLNRGKEWVTVRDEFEHVENYLTIQKIRYRDILDFTIEYDGEMADKSMLKLLLQPLVENALYHGIKNKRGRGMITVRGWREDGKLCFRVEDNGIGLKAERLEEIRRQIDVELDSSMLSDVYGLYNVNKRLALYYDSLTKLDISSVYREGTAVSFRLPERINHV